MSGRPDDGGPAPPQDPEGARGPEEPAESPARAGEGAGEGAGERAGEDGSGDGPAPYGNLLVPLVVVPAVIVMVVVLVFVFFAGIVGEESSPRQNLEVMLTGGKNARQQAAFNLVRQTLEAWHAESEGRDAEWDIDDSLLPDLQQAWERTHESEVATRLVLANLLTDAGVEGGLGHLIEMTRLDPELDPDGHFRSYAALGLGLRGPFLQEEGRTRAADALIELLGEEDEALAGVAVASLQNLPSPRTVPALEGMLSASSLELRGNAALALAELGRTSGEGVLLELLDEAPYEEDRRAADGRKWSQQYLVSDSRRRALATLVAIGRTPSRDVLEDLADDPDLELRGDVRRLLREARE